MFGGRFVKKNALWLNKFIALKKVAFQRITYSTTPYFYATIQKKLNRVMKTIMKRLFLVCGASVMCVVTTSAQQLSQEDSNPVKMGWMQGFPPMDNMVVEAADGSFFNFPALRYTVCNMRQFVPTKVVKCATTDRYRFREAIDPGIEKIQFVPMFETEPVEWQAFLDKNYVDGVIILHKGKIVYEKYQGALKPDGTHSVMSVSKTFTGTLGAILVAEGVLDENKLVKEYVPELAQSAFGDATVRNLLDMTTALKYSEDYSDPNSDIWEYSAAGNLQKPEGYKGAMYYYQYLEKIKKSGEHGKKFAYKTVNTDALGWVISRATGKSIPDLLSEKIWVPMGANYDGYYQVDPRGIAFAGGGFNANLRDLAMFGEMVRRRGWFNGKQIMPEQVVDDILKNADNARFDQESYPNLKGWGYRDMWWVTNNPDKAFCARGVYGQTIYIDMAAEMVLVRLASMPVASNAANDPYSLPAYQAVADYLMEKY